MTTSPASPASASLPAWHATLWQRLRQQSSALFAFADRAPADYPFVASDIGAFHRLHAGADDIDVQTWSDLLVDRYAATLAPQTSIFGRQLIEHRLRAGQDDEACAAQVERVRALIGDDARRAAATTACRPLRDADREIATLLFADARPVLPWWARANWIAPVVLPLALIIALVAWPAAWLVVFAALFVLMATQMQMHERVEAWQRELKSVQMLLRCCTLLAPADRQAGRVNRRLSRIQVSDKLPGVREYADWFGLANVRHYVKTVAIVFEQRDFLRGCYLHCAGVEADLALARHLVQAPTTCWATRREDRGIDLEQAVHPLMTDPAPLSIALQDKGAFISGQNGVGKSTLLRTLGLNLLVARAFGFCYAHKAHLPALPVYASMQSEDSLEGGRSLYMAELARARELLTVADSGRPAIFVIDEIFRGTNHLESVAAAAAVLDQLAAQSLVIVSSHNLVLAALLAHRLDPWCVAPPSAPSPPSPPSPPGTRQTLARGVLAHTNGIALLAAHGFGSGVEASAGKVFDWLSGYLAQPADGATVLVTP
jgi:hypothetical protein